LGVLDVDQTVEFMRNFDSELRTLQTLQVRWRSLRGQLWLQ
jgi:hypothetical protein